MAVNLHAAHRAFQVQLAADGRSEHTRNQYQRHVLGMLAWLTKGERSTDLAAITPAVVAEFFGSDAARQSARGGLKRATSANAQRTSLRCFFRWAHESGLTPNNAARQLRRARCAPPPPKGLHGDEQERLLALLAAATGAEARRDELLVQLLLGCGVRIGSALGLDVEDLDLVHGELTLRTFKGNRPTSVLVPKGLVGKLQAFLGDRTTGPLFLAGDRRICMRHSQRRLARWLKAAGISGRSAHSLRHSFAAALLAKTGDLRLVQQALNHASIVSTTIYTQVDRAKLRAAVGG